MYPSAHFRGTYHGPSPGRNITRREDNVSIHIGRVGEDCMPCVNAGVTGIFLEYFLLDDPSRIKTVITRVFLGNPKRHK
jgi:hypothetical protein